MDPSSPPAGEGEGPSLEGEVLDGRYRIESRLGAGGMATVYLAEDGRLSRKVVVKVPHAALLLEEGFRRRFEKEISSLTTLEHPHVVKIHDTGEFRGFPFAVMQHLAGGSLFDRMKSAGGRPPASDVLLWLRGVATALDFIHAQGMVHRDVKPENILFDRAGNPFVADFGIARLVSRLETKITRTGLIAGSPAYMAPEVARGREAGPAYDQYALALVVYEALSGRLPHEGTTPLSLITKRAYEPAVELATLVPEAPGGAVAAVMKALALEPEERFPSCGAFAAAYEEGLAAPPAGERTAAPTPRARAPSTTVAPTPPRQGVSRKILVAGAVAVVAVGAAALAGLFDRKAEPVLPNPQTAGTPPKPAEPAPPQPVEAPYPKTKEPFTPPWKLVTPPGAPEWVRISEEQVAAAERHKVPAWFENDLGMRFVLIPEGSVHIGSPPDEPGRQPNEPLLDVTVERPFYLQATELTNQQFRAWIPDHSSGEYKGANCDSDLQPVLKVSGIEAEGFCAWLTTRQGPRTYRLPSEGEWEYACRAGTTGPHFWGKDLLQCGRYANVADLAAKRRMPDWSAFGCDDGWFEPAPIGSFAPNPWGLHDMIGNVLEIMGASSTGGDPETAVRPTTCVVRGGGFDGDLKTCRAAARLEGTYDGPWIDGGIRVAANIPEPASASIDSPSEGATVKEGAVTVKGAAKGVSQSATLLVNGVRTAAEKGRFEAVITLPPGEQEIEVLLDGKPLALRKVKVAAAPRPGPDEGVPEWAKVSAQQVAEAARLGVPVAFENPLGMRFVLIPAGRFLMGARPQDKGSTEKMRAVTLTKPFYMCVTEVTNAQYRCWTAEHHTPLYGRFSLDGDSQPATTIGSAGADGFVGWLSGRESPRTYRLPTEAEWEFACRAGTSGRYWWGDDDRSAGKYANVTDASAKAEWPDWQSLESDDGQPVSAPVGSYPPNPWGLYDIVGNAAEFCADSHQPYESLPPVDPFGNGDAKDRILRGGAWGSLAFAFQASSRGWGEPPGGRIYMGFRVAAEIPAALPSGGGTNAEVRIVEPTEGASPVEGAVVVRGWARGVSQSATVLVNGVRAVVKAGAIEATITLPPGEQEIEVLLDGKPLALRKVKVAAAPRPGPAEGVPGWAKVSAQQVAEAKRLGVPVAFENPLGMRFVLIPAGRFHMGSPESEKDRAAVEQLHPVSLSRAFYLQATEVTNEQFRRWRKEHSSGMFMDESLNGDLQPAASVNWIAVSGFCEWLDATDGKRGYRLPTEAEWEYACRAGTATRFWWGESEEDAGRYANVADRAGKRRNPNWRIFDTDDGYFGTAPAGSFAPSPWGLWDILGNVGELCGDGPREYTKESALDPAGPTTGSERTGRGGHFTADPPFCRCAGRFFPDTVFTDVRSGFRVACDLPERK